MKQNKVLEQLKLLKGGATHKNTPYFRALAEAIRCVEENKNQKELIGELIEFMEGWTEHDMPTEAWEILQCLLQKAKELSG